jgi:aerobic-type carbon monoxide dehydrogenase small subunit (CoxS/CutS family)
MSAKALLDANPAPSDDELKEALEGNICRCTGYQPIITYQSSAEILITDGGAFRLQEEDDDEQKSR